jgi:hypothetical protein
LIFDHFTREQNLEFPGYVFSVLCQWPPVIVIARTTDFKGVTSLAGATRQAPAQAGTPYSAKRDALLTSQSSEDPESLS